MFRFCIFTVGCQIEVKQYGINEPGLHYRDGLIFWIPRDSDAKKVASVYFIFEKKAVVFQVFD